MNRYSSGVRPNIRNIFLTLILLFTFFTYAHDVIKTAVIKKGFSDFSTYYFYSSLLKENMDIYQVGKQQGLKSVLEGRMGLEDVHSPTYQPLVYLLFRPFTWFSYNTARYLWLFLLHLFLAVFIVTLFSLTRRNLSITAKAFMLFIVLVYQPLRETLALGNTDIFIMMCLTLYISFTQRGRNIIPALFLAAGIYIKYSFGLILIYVLWKKQYRMFMNVMFFIIFFKLMAVLFTGTALQVSYLNVVTDVVAKGKFSFGVHQYSVRALISRVISGGSLAIWAGNIVALSILFLLLFYTRRRGRNFFPEISLWITAVFIMSPYSALQHFTLLLIPLGLLLIHLESRGSLAQWGLYGAAFLLTGLRYSLIRFSTFYVGVPALFSFGQFYGVVILFILGIIVVRKNYE